MHMALWRHMHRTTIMLPEDLKRRASQRAERLGISLGELIRQALDRLLVEPAPSDASDPLLAFDNAFQGPSPPDLAQNHDAYLYGDEP